MPNLGSAGGGGIAHAVRGAGRVSADQSGADGSVAGGDGGMARYVGLPATPTHPRPPCTRKATPPPYTL